MNHHHHYVPRASEISEARFQKFLKEFTTYEIRCNTQVAQDRFLDAYSIWLRHRSPVTSDNLCQAIAALRALDPSFQCPLPLAGEPT